MSALQRQIERPTFTPADRTALAVLSRALDRRRLGDVMLIVKPATVIGWHRRLVARHRTQPSQPPNRPATHAGRGELAGNQIADPVSRHRQPTFETRTGPPTAQAQPVDRWSLGLGSGPRLVDRDLSRQRCGPPCASRYLSSRSSDLPSISSWVSPQRALLIGFVRSLFRATPRPDASWSTNRIEANPNERQALTESTNRHLKRYANRRNAHHHSQSGPHNHDQAESHDAFCRWRKP